MACPICKKELPAEAKHRPFCSSRCQLVDLGNWLGERYTVPSDEAPPDETGNPTTSAASSDEEKRSSSRH
jgi:endogenous inhibitor of DNA gyrase (YacG/DUF329 family)